MTPRNRREDLTADLLHDLETETVTSTEQAEPGPASGRAPDAGEPAPFIETALYLTPRGWRRPSVLRAGRSLSLSAGPVRLRIGRWVER